MIAMQSEPSAKTNTLESSINAAPLPTAARCSPHFEKLALGQCPDALKVFDWKLVREHFLPILRQEIGLVDLEPPKKR
ncbi:MAG: hypothetical protein ACR2KT_08125 [Methylocella sp.]|nr:MAG: hypothetical protein DLM68_18025 [Hyphomicrobiales bacterium]